MYGIGSKGLKNIFELRMYNDKLKLVFINPINDIQTIYKIIDKNDFNKINLKLEDNKVKLGVKKNI